MGHVISPSISLIEGSNEFLTGKYDPWERFRITTVADLGEGPGRPGGLGPPYFQRKLRPEWTKKNFLRLAPPSPYLWVRMTAPPPLIWRSRSATVIITANGRFTIRISQNREWALKTVQNYFFVEVWRAKRKLGHLVKIHVCRFTFGCFSNNLLFLARTSERLGVGVERRVYLVD